MDSKIILHQLADGFSIAARHCGLWQPAGHSFGIRPSDTFLVSYPRSGNTWIRFLVGQVIAGHVLDFYSLEHVVPDIYATSRRRIDRIDSPRVIKSHEAYRSDYPSVVYIVRDPRDVAISFYYYLRKTGGIGHGTSLRDYLDSFPERGGADARENWAGHVSSWLTAMDAGRVNALLVRYEDIEANKLHEIERVLTFAGMDVSHARMERAIALSSREHMRRAERAKARELVPDQLLSMIGRDNTAFVRAGRSRQWIDVFDDDLKHRYERAFGELMERLGYDFG